MKSLPVLFSTLLMILTLPVFAESVLDRPIGYIPPEKPRIDWRDYAPRDDRAQERAYNTLRTESLRRMGASRACSFITGNAYARRQCFSEIK